MRHFKLLMILFIGVAISTAYSCKKDDTTDDDNPGGDTGATTCYMKKMTNSDGSYTTLAYNSDNKVIEIKSYDDTGVLGAKSVITYSNSKLSEAKSYDENGDLSSKVVYSYDAQGKVEKGNLFSIVAGALKNVGYFKYTFTGDNMTKQALFLDIQNISTEVHTYEYTYDAGNVKSVKEFAFDMGSLSLKHSSTSDYVYDGKNNPFYGIGLEYIFPDASTLSEANATKITISDDQGQLKPDESQNVVYEYNDNKYPIKQITTTFDNSSTDTTTIEYDCK